MEVLASWRPSRQLSGRSRWALWCLFLLAAPVFAAGQVALMLPLADGSPGIVTPARLTSLVCVVWLTLVWVWTADHHRRPWLMGGTAALWALLTVPALTLAGLPASDATREVAAVLTQAGVMLAYYRWQVGDDNLVPHRPGDLTALLHATVVASVVSLPLAPVDVPGALGQLRAGQIPLPATAWLLLGIAYGFVGVACVLLLTQRHPRAEALPTRLLHVNALMLGTAVAIGLELTYPSLPLSWLVLLPAVWAGLVMGPWATAGFCLVTSASLVLVQALGTVPDPRSLVTLDLLLIDSMMVAFVLVALLLSLVRDQRAHLAQEVIRHRHEALDQAELMEQLLESLDEALLLLDPAGEVQLHNRSALALLGEGRLRSEPRKWLRNRTELPARFSYALHRDDDDGSRIVSVHLAAVTYAGASGVMVVARDITHEHRRIEELASFAAVAAHDLKSPLAAVQGWLELAEEVVEHDVPRAQHALDRGRSAAARMATEIDEWLAYTVAREGELSPEPVELASLLREVAASHTATQFDLALTHTVLADRTLMRHLVSNLVGNAVKYSLPGDAPKVTVSSSLDEHGWVRVLVVDAGIGVPVGEETAIFEPFRRASTVQGTHEGSGLGLALCKRIVRRHGGTISAHRNDPGPGTTVAITLPAHRASRR